MWVHNVWDFSRINKAIYSQIQKSPKDDERKPTSGCSVLNMIISAWHWFPIPFCGLVGFLGGASSKVRSLGREDPLEKEMATHSSILAWKILRTEEPGGLLSMGPQRVGHDWVTKLMDWMVIWKTMGYISQTVSPLRSWMWLNFCPCPRVETWKAKRRRGYLPAAVLSVDCSLGPCECFRALGSVIQQPAALWGYKHWGIWAHGCTILPSGHLPHGASWLLNVATEVRPRPRSEDSPASYHVK